MAADGLVGAQKAIVREILESLKHRKERKAASAAGSLTFWDDGMLKELRAIAAGEVDPETIHQLREKFRASESRVARVIDGLLRIRNALGPCIIGRQIDAVVNSTNFGKAEVREDIKAQLETKNRYLLMRKAEDICLRIEILNDELARLNQMAYE